MENKCQVHYTALKILRQRCEFLQQRLDSLEEENCQLKLQQLPRHDSSYNNCLQEQIVLLNKNNNKMSHHIQMITAENQNLWLQLSNLMSRDENLGNSLSIQNKEFLLSPKPMESLPELLGDYNKESFEEISLKLINGILIGKTELESQYSQMIDLQKESNFSDRQFSKLPSQYDFRAAMGILNGSIQKMKVFRDVLLQQKLELNNAIVNVKSLPLNLACNNKLQSENLDNINIREHRFDPIDENDSETEKTCPMCAKSFKGSFKIFYNHVTAHFEDGNEVYGGS